MKPDSENRQKPLFIKIKMKKKIKKKRWQFFMVWCRDRQQPGAGADHGPMVTNEHIARKRFCTMVDDHHMHCRF